MTPTPESGELNDASRVRETLARSIKHCGKSREQIAESMSRLCGYSITVTMLNAFTAESRDDRRFPLELLRAFCIATGDSSLLVAIVHALNLELITETESNVLALGREYLRQKRATETMRSLEEQLARREL